MIRGYSYKPEDLVFYGIDGEQEQGQAPYYFGVELEVDNLSDRDEFDYKLQQDGYKEIYLKEDGSLSYAGVEIVSYPMTRNAHEEYDWQGIFDWVEHYGGKSHNTTTCGLHIHISKTAFESADHKAIFIALYEKFKKEFRILLRRKDHKRKEWAKDYSEAYYNEFGQMIEKVDNGWVNMLKEEFFPFAHDGKYASNFLKRKVAMNIKPEKTLEFRGFKGTTKRSSFIACIQLLDEMVKYTKGIQIIEDCEFSDFLNYIMKGTGENAELIQYIFEMIERAKRRGEITKEVRKGYLNEEVEEPEPEQENVDSVDSGDIQFNFVE
ncbi:MAG: putative amidoligase enzyme [Promethearchaeota archaeon]|nr:MAG: putative amidoligase enzyme [Candidatus Lokiarchaeota archaeon]